MKKTLRSPTFRSLHGLVAASAALCALSACTRYHAPAAAPTGKDDPSKRTVSPSPAPSLSPSPIAPPATTPSPLASMAADAATIPHPPHGSVIAKVSVPPAAAQSATSSQAPSVSRVAPAAPSGTQAAVAAPNTLPSAVPPEPAPAAAPFPGLLSFMAGLTSPGASPAVAPAAVPSTPPAHPAKSRRYFADPETFDTQPDPGTPIAQDVYDLALRFARLGWQTKDAEHFQIPLALPSAQPIATDRLEIGSGPSYPEGVAQSVADRLARLGMDHLTRVIFTFERCAEPAQKDADGKTLRGLNRNLQYSQTGCLVMGYRLAAYSPERIEKFFSTFQTGMLQAKKGGYWTMREKALQDALKVAAIDPAALDPLESPEAGDPDPAPSSSASASPAP